MENYWVGLSLRTNKSFMSMFGMNYNNIYFGYSFGLSWGDISVFNKYGTHEIMLGMKFGDNSRRYRWLNRF